MNTETLETKIKLGINPTDSKDNGAVEGMFWDALAIAGFTEADL